MMHADKNSVFGAVSGPIPDHAPLVEADWTSRKRSGVRFTSNIWRPIILLIDVLCFIITAPLTMLAHKAIYGSGGVEYLPHYSILLISLFIFCALRLSRGTSGPVWADATREDSTFIHAITSFLLASALAWQFGFTEGNSRSVSFLFMTLLVATLVLSRPLARKFLRRLMDKGAIEQRIAFYGSDPHSMDAIHGLLRSMNMPHLRVIGVADDRPGAGLAGDLPLIGGFKEVAELARSGEIDQVLISVADLPRERLDEIIEGFSAVSIDVSLIPPQAIRFAPDYRVNLLGSMPVLTLWQRPFRDINRMVKRVEDIVFSTVAILVFAPVMLLAAVLIRLTSPGPVLFIQPRIGFNNEVIQVLKFRTMFQEQTDVGGVATTTRDDPRVTPVGRLLRKLSIDELAQLFNVFRGDMSLVGPRPHAIEMKVGDRFYQDAVRGYAGRHRVKPGITGLAQVRGLRGEIRTIERAKRRVQLDKEYIDNWSVWLDVAVLLATVRAVLFDKDAY